MKGEGRARRRGGSLLPNNPHLRLPIIIHSTSTNSMRHWDRGSCSIGCFIPLMHSFRSVRSSHFAQFIKWMRMHESETDNTNRTHTSWLLALSHSTFVSLGEWVEEHNHEGSVRLLREPCAFASLIHCIHSLFLTCYLLWGIRDWTVDVEEGSWLQPVSLIGTGY